MGRVVWMMSAALLVVGIVWAWFALPETGIPMHMDLDGTVTRYGHRAEFIGVQVGMSLLTLVVTPLICVAALQGDASFLNMPNKEYWLAPERAAATKADMAERLWWFLAATNALMLATLVDPVLVALGLISASPPVALLLYVAFTVWWVARIYRRFRLPEQ